MTPLERWYASNGPERLVPTVEIKRDSAESLFLYPGKTLDYLLARDVDGTPLVFEPSPIDIALRKRDNSGSQSLTFGFENVTSRVMHYCLEARRDRDEISVIYRSYLIDGDGYTAAEPEEKPARFIVKNVTVQGDQVTIEAGYQDLINTIFNRRRYRASEYPGLLYFSS
ncbi:hypothetical protein R84981_000987 [Carnimonas sp. R-84981]|uniref:DUF1833 family protein n=1 Tax=Carnimonas bestiolae TaxID=3402172 RepID=UPI003EDBB44C